MTMEHFFLFKDYYEKILKSFKNDDKCRINTKRIRKSQTKSEKE